MISDNTNIVHSIDLEYLINPDQHKKITEKYETANKTSEDERKFYRKRMLQLTRDLIAGEISNANLESAFDNYMQESIKYFKFMDKKDIIQGEYTELNEEIKKKQERKKQQIIEEDKKKKASKSEKTSKTEKASKTEKTPKSENTSPLQLTGENADELLINRTQLKDPCMNSFIKVKRNPVEKKHIMPKQREINLEDPKLKRKGIKKRRKKKEKQP